MSTSTDRQGDALVALIVLGAFLGQAVRLGVKPSVPGAVLGALATIGLECLAGRHEKRVRALWNRTGITIAAVVAVLLAGAAFSTVLPALSLSFAIAALTTYLVLLVLVGRGFVPPPKKWC